MSQCQAVIKLKKKKKKKKKKKDRDKTLLKKNWRPISSFNVDLRIISKHLHPD